MSWQPIRRAATIPPVQQAWFDGIRQEHAEVRRAVDRLASWAADGRTLGDAIDEFLLFAAARLEPLLADEEQRLGPLLDRFLPPAIASSSGFRREHETVRELTDGLRALRGTVDASPAARADAETLVTDLALLLHDHLRREDSVLNPLLQRLSGARHD